MLLNSISNKFEKKFNSKKYCPKSNKYVIFGYYYNFKLSIISYI